MNRLVDRFGRTGAAALTSLIWAVPMAAWAGSADLTPIDQTAYPRIALSIGLFMLVVWLVIVTRLPKIKMAPRQRRLDIGQMSAGEKRWTLALAAFVTGFIAWLNAAATVDWAPLGAALRNGQPGPALFAVGLAGFLLAMLFGIWLSWRKARTAFGRRLANTP